MTLDAAQSDEPIKLPSEEAYKKACAVLPGNMFSKPNAADANLLDPNLIPEADDLPRLLESTFKPGTIFCRAVLPFNGEGKGQEELSPEDWEEFLDGKGYFKTLLVDPLEGKNVEFDSLPERVRMDVNEGGCSFKLHYPHHIGSWENKLWFAKQNKRAIENLKKFFS